MKTAREIIVSVKDDESLEFSPVGGREAVGAE